MSCWLNMFESPDVLQSKEKKKKIQIPFGDVMGESLEVVSRSLTLCCKENEQIGGQIVVLLKHTRTRSLGWSVLEG